MTDSKKVTNVEVKEKEEVDENEFVIPLNDDQEEDVDLSSPPPTADNKKPNKKSVTTTPSPTSCASAVSPPPPPSTKAKAAVRVNLSPEERQLQEVAFKGQLLCDATGESLICFKHHDWCFSVGGDGKQDHQQQQQRLVKLRSYSISAAVTDARGNRSRKQWGVDDPTYEHYPLMRHLVPRCFCIVMQQQQQQNGNGEWNKGAAAAASSAIVVGELKGMPKFTGLDSQEEDEEEGPNRRTADHMCSRGRIAQATNLLVTNKANGKSCGLSAFTHHETGQRFLILGSKNVHVVVRADLPITPQLPSETTSDLVMQIAVAMQRQLSHMSPANREELMGLLEVFSLCGEFEDGQHLIPLGEGQVADIKWFALVPKKSDDVLSSMDRWWCLTTLRKLGLTTVDFHIHPISEMMAVLATLRRTPHIEGAVIDFLKPSSSNNNRTTTSNGSSSSTSSSTSFEVLETVKFKSVWYVLTRSVREIIKGQLSEKRVSGVRDRRDSVESTIARIEKTITARSNDFLHLPDTTMQQYFALYRRFVEWFHGTQGHTGRDIGAMGMAFWWQQFLKATGANDVIELPQVDENAMKDRLSTTENNGGGASTTSGRGKGAVVGPVRMLIMTHGMPGDGKSSRAAVLVQELRKCGMSSEMFEQDQHHGDAAAAHAAFQEGLCGGSAEASLPRVVFLSRCNANPRQYARYVGIARAQGFIVVGLVPEEIESDEMALVCMDSILKRDATKHGTMNNTDSVSQAEYLMIMLSFRQQFAMPSISKGDVDDVIVFKSLKSTFKAPEAACQYLASYMKDIKAAPFKVQPRPLAQVVACTLADTQQYSQHRLPLDEVVPRLVAFIVQKVKAAVPLLPTPSFMGVLVPRDKAELLRALVNQQCGKLGMFRSSLNNSDIGGDDGSNNSNGDGSHLTWFLHHVTFGHFKTAAERPLLWRQQLDHVCTRTLFTVTCRKLMIKSATSTTNNGSNNDQSGVGVGVAAAAVLVDVSLSVDGSDQRQLVFSGIPHITAFVGAGSRAGDLAGIILHASPQMVFDLTPDQVASLTWSAPLVGLC